MAVDSGSAETRDDVAARLIFRVDFGGGRRLGLGTLLLLEGLGRTQSLAETARAMEISDRRALELVERLNGMFKAPVIAADMTTRCSQRHSLTTLGQTLLARLRDVEASANAASAAHLHAIAEMLYADSN